MEDIPTQRVSSGIEEDSSKSFISDPSPIPRPELVVCEDNTTAFDILRRVVDVVVVDTATTTTLTLLHLLTNEKYYNLAKSIIKLGYFTYPLLEDDTRNSKATVQTFIHQMKILGIIEKVSKLKNRDGPATILFRTPRATQGQMDEAIKRDRAFKHQPLPFNNIKPITPPEPEIEKPLSRHTLERMEKFKELIKPARA